MESNYFHSVVLKSERCVGCTYCLKICPTEAIRLKDGKASIIAERCIDCGECIRVCPNHAKNAITDDFEILKKFKYNIALTLPVLYGQFNRNFTPAKILNALKSLGFDEVSDTSKGFEIVGIVSKSIINSSVEKPVISSTCPAILRLIQVRFPELLRNILDIETPVEITARLIKDAAAKKTGLSLKDIGVILITPCTARVTSIKSPLGIDFSYINGTISIKNLYGSMIKALSSNEPIKMDNLSPTHNGILSSCVGGQIMMLQEENTLAIDGIHNAISVLEEIEMGRLNNLSFIELSACPGGCIGGPLTVENRHIALNNIKNIACELENPDPSNATIEEYNNLYKNGYIRLTKKIESKIVSRLDSDIQTSIKKMDAIRNIVDNLPGINCGVCGSPTCQAFAEDIITGSQTDPLCPIENIIKKLNKDIKN